MSACISPIDKQTGIQKKTGDSAIIKVKNAALKVSEAFKAYNYTVDQSKIKDSLGREINSIVLTLNFLDFNKDYKKSKVASASALILFKDIDQSKYNEYDRITVILKAPKIEYKKDYSISDIKKANELMKNATAFINSLQTYNNDYKKSIDKTLILNADIEKTRNMFSTLTSTYGKMTSIIITGFNYNHSTETNEPILVLWIETNFNKNVSFFKFYISLTSNKIIYFMTSSKAE